MATPTAPRPASAGARRSAGTSAAGRRRRVPTRRRRCRHGSRGTRCARRWDPWAGARPAARPRARRSGPARRALLRREIAHRRIGGELVAAAPGRPRRPGSRRSARPRAEVGVLLGEGAIAVEVARDVGRAQQAVELGEAGRELVELAAEGRLHRCGFRKGCGSRRNCDGVHRRAALGRAGGPAGAERRRGCRPRPYTRCRAATSSARSASPAALSAATCGCRSLLVRPRASASSTASGVAPPVSIVRARASSAARSAS